MVNDSDHAPDLEGLERAEAAWARAGFLQKVYSLLLLGVAVFAATLWLTPRVEALFSLMRFVYSNAWVAILLLLGSAFGVRAVARRPGIGLVGYLAYSFLLGIFVSLPVALAPEGTVGTAALLTLSVFAGLTTYAFVTKNDFSWMGGALYIGLFAMIGIGLCGLIFGFHPGTWYSLAGALLFSGFILYDTSNIIHRYRNDEALPAAVELFADVVLLFWNLLSLLNRD